jgi:Holliday junction resolvasome RuvABC endonuclease subunit
MPTEAKEKARPSRVLGIDTSTNALAFCVYEGGAPIYWGKVNLTGPNIYARVSEANKKASALLSVWDIDFVVVEKAIMGASPDGSLKIAMIVGAALAAVIKDHVEVITVAPVSWQSYLGNKLLTKAEKQEIADLYPGRTVNYIKAKQREFRKQRTINWVNDKWGIPITDNDVSDAIGIAHWGAENI